MTEVEKKLLDISSSALATTHARRIPSALAGGTNIAAVYSMLENRNGFFAFESALHVFPDATVQTSWGLEDWNDPKLWKNEFKGLAESVWCFAEDIFGVQFCVSVEDHICTFNPETGDIVKLAQTVTEWASKILLDWRSLTGYQVAREWQQRNGALQPRHRLMAKRPFILGGSYELSNFSPIDSVELMRNRGNLARQIHHLPDGTKIILDSRPT